MKICIAAIRLPRTSLLRMHPENTKERKGTQWNDFKMIRNHFVFHMPQSCPAISLLCVSVPLWFCPPLPLFSVGADHRLRGQKSGPIRVNSQFVSVSLPPSSDFCFCHAEVRPFQISAFCFSRLNGLVCQMPNACEAINQPIQ